MHTPSGQCCVQLYARILSTSFSSISIFSVCCYSIVSISMGISLYTRSSSEGKFVEYSARLGEEFVHETNKKNFAPTLVNYDFFLAMSLPFPYLMLCLSLCFIPSSIYLSGNLGKPLLDTPPSLEKRD